MAATLQEATGGRLILGIGAGGSDATPYAAEQYAIGQPVGGDRVRRQRVIEAVQVIRRLWAGDTSDFAGQYYRLQRLHGYLRPNPPPPLIVGAFGPKMADVAGRYADGLNTQAFHPRLAEMIATARRAREASGRDPAGLLVTVFAGLAETWLRRGSRSRAALEDLGVDRLILLIDPPFDESLIREAGRLLTA
jgi:alkanesulfonate monooxygenase SsuD/methylene tetrahydromethanopterin reductase-like flavin-dependent oxidoreductase (luciferase family)